VRPSWRVRFPSPQEREKGWGETGLRDRATLVIVINPRVKTVEPGGTLRNPVDRPRGGAAKFQPDRWNDRHRPVRDPMGKWAGWWRFAPFAPVAGGEEARAATE